MWRISKLSINTIKSFLKTIFNRNYSLVLMLLLSICICLCSSMVYSANAATYFSEKDIKKYAANSIYFIGTCTPGSSGRKSGNVSSICGDTAREKYWSLLRSVLGINDVAAAAMLGNSDHEGFLSPTQWQYNIVPQGTSQFKHSWDELYNCPDNGCPGGIGAFQNTTWQGSYLRNLNNEAPDLLKYYKDASYSRPGDEALAKIGATDFDRLAEADVRALMKNRKDVVEHMRTIPDDESYLDEATEWFTKNYENCGCCGGNYALTHNGGCSSELPGRKNSAHDSYNLIKTFTCSGSSKTDDSDDKSDDEEDKKDDKKDKDDKDSDNKDSSSTGDGITWIGDSYSVGANAKGLISKNFSDVDFGPGNPDTASSYIKVSKTVSGDDKSNPSCLSILEKVVKNDKLKPNLVFACGTNGTWNDANIKKFKDLLDGKNTKAVVVNSRIPSNDYAEANKLLKKLADENENIALADWASVYSGDFFKSDSIHPNDDPGYEKWVGVISDALSNAKPGCSDATFEGDYPSYPQCGSSWSNESYGDGKTMCSASCGASSMAMLATVAANKDVLPTDVRDLLGGSYYWATSGSGMSALDKKVGEKYGFEVEDVSYSDLNDAEKKMSKYLDDGYMLHFSGAGSYPFSAGGHYIGVFGWTDKDKGKVMLANSGGAGNKEESLHDVIHAGLHGGSFSAIKKGGSKSKCDDNPSNDVCPGDSDNNNSNEEEGGAGTCSAKTLNSVKTIIGLAKKNDYEYAAKGHDIDGSSYFNSILKDNAKVEVDCTGFASLVMYDAFGVKQTFSTFDIASNPNYKEIAKSDVQPGDIFSYNSCTGTLAHGGIVLETKNGKFTKIAQTGKTNSGYNMVDGAVSSSGSGRTLGYFEDLNGSNSNLRCLNGDASDLKFYRYKECD